MNTPEQILKKLNKIDVDKASVTAIENTSTEMVDIQKDQLFQGIGPDGKDVKPHYAARTIAIKKKKGQPYDRVTRKDLGNYYAGIKVDVTGDKFILESTDEKAEKLNEKYGDIGLSKDSKKEYIKTLEPEFLKVIKAQYKNG